MVKASPVSFTILPPKVLQNRARAAPGGNHGAEAPTCHLAGNASNANSGPVKENGCKQCKTCWIFNIEMSYKIKKWVSMETVV